MIVMPGTAVKEPERLMAGNVGSWNGANPSRTSANAFGQDLVSVTSSTPKVLLVTQNCRLGTWKAPIRADSSASPLGLPHPVQAFHPAVAG